MAKKVRIKRNGVKANTHYKIIFLQTEKRENLDDMYLGGSANEILVVGRNMMGQGSSEVTASAAPGPGAPG